MVNGVYRISEKGHEEHEDDVIIHSDLINSVISLKYGFDIEKVIKKYDEDRKKDKEND